MSDDPFKRGRRSLTVLDTLQDRIDGIHRLTEPAATAVARINADFERADRARQMALSPVVDTIRQINASHDQLREHMSVVNRALAPTADFHAQLTQAVRGITGLSNGIGHPLPGRLEITQFLPKLPDLSAIYGTRIDITGFAEAMANMRTPWSDTRNALASITSFARLQGLGQAVHGLQPFDGALTKGLRHELGDWRDKISWPTELAVPDRRLALYVDRGFDPELTALAPEAFTESAALAGLETIEVHRLDPVMDVDGDQNEDDQRRTETAFRVLHRMEVELRQFIDRVMTAAYGEDWPRHRLAPKTFEDWNEKRKKAEVEGGPSYPLIFYADFMDYQAIICRKDDWKGIFAPFFRRPESVRESFQRLHPVRLATMHARFVTPEDAVFLMAETVRIMRAIGRLR